MSLVERLREEEKAGDLDLLYARSLIVDAADRLEQAEKLLREAREDLRAWACQLDSYEWDIGPTKEIAARIDAFLWESKEPH